MGGREIDNLKAIRILAVSLLAVLSLFHLVGRKSDQGLRAVMARHGLSHASIAHGRAGAPPRLLTIDARASRSYPFYSLSKPITAATVLALVRSGEIDLEETYAGATVRDLLRHSGGWDRDLAPDPVLLREAPQHCVDLSPPPRQFRPGSRSAYANVGYCLLGKLVEERTGLAFREAAARAVPQTRAMGFDEWLGPAGGWSGTAARYFDFASAPLDPLVLERPGFTPAGPYYALGWRVLADGTVSHYGVLRGNYSVVFKRGETALVALFDGRPSDPDAAREDLLAALGPMMDGAGR